MTDEPNPYRAPRTDFAGASQEDYARARLRKIEAIVKDADQFWLGILFGLLCCGVGTGIVSSFYLLRLIQWHWTARADPRLPDPNVPHGSLARRFQSAKIKLIIGISFSAAALLLSAAFVLFGQE